ncbi:MAG: hypothetical protein HYT14_01580, partial [Candidatus Liptonbacteria bacterium]|nr:hypothetical protein [Candidatus Liptonbacteria bacterium]
MVGEWTTWIFVSTRPAPPLPKRQERSPMPELTITLRRAKEMNACVESYTAVRKALGRDWTLDTPLPLLRLLDLRGLSDTLWALRCIPQEQADAKRWAVSNW